MRPRCSSCHWREYRGERCRLQVPCKQLQMRAPCGKFHLIDARWIGVKSTAIHGCYNVPYYSEPVWILYDDGWLGIAAYDPPDDEWWLYCQDGTERYCTTVTYWQPQGCEPG